MILGLPQKRYATVFRLIVQRLQTDPTLKNVVKSWLVWSSSPIDRSGQTLGMTPSVRLTPQLGGSDWYSEDSRIVPLQIKVELLLEGIDADDCLNLWEAIEEAFYPVNDRAGELAWEDQLRPYTEIPYLEFNQPASIQAADENQFLCVGTMRIGVLRLLTP